MQVNSIHVSNMAKLFDEGLEAFRGRSLSEFSYVFFDAQYQRIRFEGIVRNLAILKARTLCVYCVYGIDGISGSYRR